MVELKYLRGEANERWKQKFTNYNEINNNLKNSGGMIAARPP